MRQMLAIFAFVIAVIAAFVLWPSFRPVPPIRDRALPTLPAGDQPLVVVAFGTSLTARGRWPGLLGEKLTQCLGRAVEMHVVARPGAGSDWAIQTIGDVIAHKPDLALVEFSMNDADLLDGVSLGTSKAQHVELLEGLINARPNLRVLLMTMNPVTGLQRLKRPRLQAYYDVYHELAQAQNTGLADLAPRWMALPARWTDDGVHPRTDISAQILPQTLSKMIAAAADVGCS